jgi:serine/threonine protein kinase/Flp pilus assembly protein TadD
VESLVVAYERTEHFIETPAFEVAPQLLISERRDALIGESIDHYRIESLIGVGGMGEVYLARDEGLGRKVALKLLPQQLMADETQVNRFKTEARAASALNHPNILTVYEIISEGDRQFIATEFIEGVTLRAWLSRGKINLRDALEVAIQVASGLAAAHEAGVVHRDIKPENIMLRPDGYVKVLDFGIAKLSEQQPAVDRREPEEIPAHQTQSGQVVGTARYMSPEQARRENVDARSDIWSLGAVLYEMVAGIPPFQGETSSDYITSILTKEPTPLSATMPDVPARLESIVEKALRKDRNARYQTSQEMLADLRSLKAQLDAEGLSFQAGTLVKLSVSQIKGTKRGMLLALLAVVLGVSALFVFRSLQSSHPPAATAGDLTSNPAIPEKSIAVLPFENLSHDPDSAFFADGVQEEILTDLARIADLKVIGRTSVMQYNSGVARDLRKIGQQLGVAHLVEGTVQRSGNRLRVNAQLADARTERRSWEQVYDGDLTDVFAIESEIATAIAGELNAKLSPNEKSDIERPVTVNIPAFDLYTQANDLLLVESFSDDLPGHLRQAANLLNWAVARDPAFFEAYCQLGYAHDVLYFYGYDHTPARLASAELAIQAAFRLRPDAGEAHLARAQNLYWGYLDYDDALAELDVARRSLPNNARIFLLSGYIHRRQGRWEESARDLDRAVELDPRNLDTLLQIAINYDLFRRYAEEKLILDRALAIEPSHAEIKVVRANVDLDWKANTQPLHQVIDEIRAENPASARGIANDWLICALAEHNAAAAQDALIALGDTPLRDGTVHLNRPVVEGLIARMMHDETKARVAFTAALADQEKIVQAQPNYGPPRCALGLIYAALGRKEEALREGRRAVELLPMEKDAIWGPAMHRYLAKIAAWVGDNDMACEELAIATPVPSGVSYGQLKLMPWWDPLRGDPRFEGIVASLAPE